MRRASGGRRHRDLRTCSADPQLAANDGFLQLPADPDGKTRRSINGPVSFSDLPAGPAAPAPLLGEHTDEVLSEMATRRPLDDGPSQA